jgi:indole-3-glycerol phosphate synthase
MRGFNDSDWLIREASLVGINNRDLATFTVSLETTLRLRDRAPDRALVVSESGIRGASDVARLKAAGVGAVLVGEHLLRQPDLAGAVSRLMGEAWACS